MTTDTLPWSSDLPYGRSDIAENASLKYGSGSPGGFVHPEEIQCCIKGCGKWLSRRRRGQLKQPEIFCPEHNISISTTPTYIYKNYLHNFVVGRRLLTKIKKVERWRLGNENSEDALSWNLFVGLLYLGGLGECFRAITGISHDSEPQLYLWGNKITPHNPPHFWDRLSEVRKQLEAGSGLPTEPDIALRIPGKALLLIEAKFSSQNGVFSGKEDRFGSVQEYLGRYHPKDEASDPLNREWIAHQAPSVILEQLCRNAVFAHWLAEKGEQIFLVNLVRERQETDIAERFAPHINASNIIFKRVKWEQLCNLNAIRLESGDSLRRYLENKTLCLERAFLL